MCMYITTGILVIGLFWKRRKMAPGKKPRMKHVGSKWSQSNWWRRVQTDGCPLGLPLAQSLSKRGRSDWVDAASASSSMALLPLSENRSQTPQVLLLIPVVTPTEGIIIYETRLRQFSSKVTGLEGIDEHGVISQEEQERIRALSDSG